MGHGILVRFPRERHGERERWGEGEKRGREGKAGEERGEEGRRGRKKKKGRKEEKKRNRKKDQSFCCLLYSGLQVTRSNYSMESIVLYPNFTDLNIDLIQKHPSSWHMKLIITTTTTDGRR